MPKPTCFGETGKRIAWSLVGDEQRCLNEPRFRVRRVDCYGLVHRVKRLLHRLLVALVTMRGQRQSPVGPRLKGFLLECDRPVERGDGLAGTPCLPKCPPRLKPVIGVVRSELDKTTIAVRGLAVAFQEGQNPGFAGPADVDGRIDLQGTVEAGERVLLSLQRPQQ